MKELNLTQGSVPKVLLQFAVPFLIANVANAMKTIKAVTANKGKC